MIEIDSVLFSGAKKKKMSGARVFEFVQGSREFEEKAGTKRRKAAVVYGLRQNPTQTGKGLLNTVENMRKRTMAIDRKVRTQTEEFWKLAAVPRKLGRIELERAVRRNASKVARSYREFEVCRVWIAATRRSSGCLKETHPWTDAMQRRFALHAVGVRHFFMNLANDDHNDNDDDEDNGECRRIKHYRCKLSILDATPVQLFSTRYFKCESFEARLLELSELSRSARRRWHLERVLRKLCFSKNQYLYDAETRTWRLFAVVAGSYPSTLAGTLAKYNDIDVFVLVTRAGLTALRTLWRFLLAAGGGKFSKGAYDRWNVDSVLAVIEFGKLQIILKYYGEEPCLCDFHVDRDFFKDFHHATRWKLDVYRDFFLVRYIYADEKKIARCTAIEREMPTQLVRETIVNRLGAGLQHSFVRFRIQRKALGSYPQKHSNNVLNWGPPSLAEQSLRAYLSQRCLGV